MNLTIGRIVHYRLSEIDAQDINRKRHSFLQYKREHPAEDTNTGLTGHFGNQVSPGDIYPAMIVRVFPGNPHDVVNLQVHLDGNDLHWVTSRHHGGEDGEWNWPPRVPEFQSVDPRTLADYEYKT